jgi:hypothetical protein
MKGRKSGWTSTTETKYTLVQEEIASLESEIRHWNNHGRTFKINVIFARIFLVNYAEA